MGSEESTREEVRCSGNEDVMSGVTKLDRIRNQRIRGTTMVGEISKKVQESRLKWYGQLLRRKEEYVGKRMMVMEVPGKRRRGRLKRRWLDSIRNELSERELSGRTRKTLLDGGVSQDTSTPHKSGKRCIRRTRRRRII